MSSLLARLYFLGSIYFGTVRIWIVRFFRDCFLLSGWATSLTTGMTDWSGERDELTSTSVLP